MAVPMRSKAWRCSLVGSVSTGTAAGMPANRTWLRVRVARWPSRPRKIVRSGVPLGGVVFAGYWREVMWNRPRSRSATRCGRTECREIRYCRRSPPAGRPRRRAGLPRRQGDCRRGCACARGRRASRRCSRRLLLRSLGRLIAGVLAVPADAGAHFLPRESVGEPFMTPKTVEARRLRIRRKLGVRSRAELARKPARQSG